MNNDSDVDSTILSLTGVTSPSNGVTVISGTGIEYTPNTGYVGTDSFNYQIMDDTGLVSNSVSVSITVVSTNLPPTANSGSVSTNEDVTLIANATGSDPESSTLTYSIVTPASFGGLSMSSTGRYIYTPSANYYGTDSFTFQVSDGVNFSAPATIDITINSVNDAPTVSGANYTATGNNLASFGHVLSGTLSASDIEGDILTFTGGANPTNGVLVLDSSGSFTYTPAMNYIGPDSFTFRVSDGAALSAYATVNITVVSNGFIPPPSGGEVLSYFSITAPTTAIVGQPIIITVSPMNASGQIITTHTGTIAFSSIADTGATFPTTGLTYVPATHMGVRTFNGITLSRT
jgi:large repetitive protein